LGYYEIIKTGNASTALTKSLKPLATKRVGKWSNIDRNYCSWRFSSIGVLFCYTCRLYCQWGATEVDWQVNLFHVRLFLFLSFLISYERQWKAMSYILVSLLLSVLVSCHLMSELSDRRFRPRLFLFISFLNFFWRLRMHGMVPN
jgi:hypothetical protein